MECGNKNKLNLSPNYLSRLLKSLMRQSTKQFIIEKVIDLVKIKLSTTELTISEIAYELGFEHPQSFNKLFKAKQLKLQWAFVHHLTERSWQDIQ